MHAKMKRPKNKELLFFIHREHLVTLWVIDGAIQQSARGAVKSIAVDLCLVKN